MKKFLLGAAAAGAALAGVAHAEEATKPTFSGNVALTSDYLFRGITQTDENPAIQGGFDFGYGMFYAGAWASSVDFSIDGTTTPGIDASLEFDLYAGVKPVTGPVSWDFGVVGYFYPGADDETAELDYQEVYAKASIAPTKKLALGAALFFSPEFTGETSTGVYYEANAGYTLTDKLALSGAVGHQTVDDLNGPVGGGSPDDGYTTWNIGAGYSLAGFSFDLRYVDTDIDSDNAFVTSGFIPEYKADGRGVFTVKRAL